MRITTEVPELPIDAVRRALQGLPVAHGYELRVKPLRYREKPHLAALTEFDERRITIQIPEPFFPFGEVIPYAAKRRPGTGKMRFIWLTDGVTFRTRREVLRFLYCHEWMHWYLKETLGRKSQAETSCDRFALFNRRRLIVTVEDAERALAWRYGDPR